jgi:hypothetical protein
MMERLWNQAAGRTPRPTAASLYGAHQLAPSCLSQSPISHLCQVLAWMQGCLCFKVGFPTRPGIWSACLSSAKCFQLALGNWCQLLWGEPLGTSCAAGRWARECGWSLACEPGFPQGAWVAWMHSCWKMVFTWWRVVAAGWRPSSVHECQATCAAAEFAESKSCYPVCWLLLFLFVYPVTMLSLLITLDRGIQKLREGNSYSGLVYH